MNENAKETGKLKNITFIYILILYVDNSDSSF